MIFLPTHDSSNCGNDFELLIPIPVTIPIPNTSLDSRICMRGTNQQGDYLPTVSIGFNGRVRHHTQKDQQKEQKKKNYYTAPHPCISTFTCSGTMPRTPPLACRFPHPRSQTDQYMTRDFLDRWSRLRGRRMQEDMFVQKKIPRAPLSSTTSACRLAMNCPFCPSPPAQQTPRPLT